MKLFLFIFFILLIFENTQAETIYFNGSNDWDNTTYTLISHGDRNMRLQPLYTDGLVSYYNPSTDLKTGNTLTDIWGNNDGTLYGASWNNSVIDLDGIDDYIDYGTDSSLDFSSSCTIVTRVMTKNNTMNYGMIFANQETNPSYQLGLYTTTGKIYFYAGTLLGGKISISDSSIQNYTFYDLAGSYDKDESPDNVLSYIDGVSSIPDTGISDLYTNTGSLISGMRNYKFYFNGSIGHSYLYNIGLTNNQINDTSMGKYKNSGYIETEIFDAGLNKTWQYFYLSGLNVGTETVTNLQINGSNDGYNYSGWVNLSYLNYNSSYNIPGIYRYRYAQFRVNTNTSDNTLTDIIYEIRITSDDIITSIPTKLIIIDVFKTEKSKQMIIYSDGVYLQHLNYSSPLNINNSNNFSIFLHDDYIDVINDRNFITNFFNRYGNLILSLMVIIIIFGVMIYIYNKR